MLESSDELGNTVIHRLPRHPGSTLEFAGTQHILKFRLQAKRSNQRPVRQKTRW